MNLESTESLVLFSILWYGYLIGFLFSIDYFTACFRRWSVFSIVVPLLLVHHGVSVPFVFEAASDAHGIATSAYLSRWISILVAMYAFLLVGAGVIGRSHPRSAPLDTRLLGGFGQVDMSPILVLFVISCIGILIQLAVAPRLVSLGDLFSAEISAEEYREQRYEFAEYTSGVKGLGNYLVNVAVSSVVPMILFVAYQARAQSVAYKATFYFTLLLLTVRAAFTGHKANVVIVIVSLAAIHLFLRDQGRLRLRRTHFAAAGVGLFLIVPLLYWIQYAAFISGYLEAFEAGFYRLFVEPNRALQLYAYSYPDIYGHLYGASSRFIAALYDADGQFIPPHTLLPLSWGITDVTWNVVFTGDAWADFGIYGVMAQSFLVGAMLRAIDVWFWSRSQRGWLEVGVLFAEMFSIVRLGFVGLATVLFGFGIIPSLFFWWMAVVAKVRTMRRRPMADRAVTGQEQ